MGCKNTQIIQGHSGGVLRYILKISGSVDFYLNWSDYKHGFGDPSGELWLGNEKIHLLTSGETNMLCVDLEDFEGNTACAEYNMFGVMSENDKYKLILGSYSGMNFLFFILHCKSNAFLKVEYEWDIRDRS